MKDDLVRFLFFDGLAEGGAEVVHAVAPGGKAVEKTAVLNVGGRLAGEAGVSAGNRRHGIDGRVGPDQDIIPGDGFEEGHHVQAVHRICRRVRYGHKKENKCKSFSLFNKQARYALRKKKADERYR